MAPALRSPPTRPVSRLAAKPGWRRSCKAGAARDQIDARLCPKPHCPPTILGWNQVPDYYVEGSEEALAAAPQNSLGRHCARAESIGVWPRSQFSGLADTLQLNYAIPELQVARIDELIAIAGKCDGVRCDMAMLLLPEIFQRTWGIMPTILAQGDCGSAQQISALHLHGRGLLGLRMDLTTAGLWLLLRQAAL